MRCYLGNKGFTLLEVLIVLSLTIIMLGTAYYYMGNRGAKAQLKSDARDLASNFNLARVGAIRDSRPWAVSFDTANRRYLLYSDSGEAAGSESWNDGNETVFRTVQLSTLVFYGSQSGMRPGATSLPASGVSFTSNRVVFNPNGTSQMGTVYVTVPDGATMAVGTQSTTGLVRIWTNLSGTWSN